MNKEQIREIRLAAHLLQKEFGALIGVSACTVSAWETGRAVASIPHQRKLIEFCQRYGIEV